MENVDTSLQHRIDHMAKFLGYWKDEGRGRWYNRGENKIICETKDWRPHQNWNQLMRVYEKICNHPRTSETNDYKKDTVYIDRFEVGTNQIFISLWCMQPDSEFDHSTIYHGHSRLKDVEGDCDSTKEMFFKSVSDFVTIVQYTKDLYG